MNSINFKSNKIIKNFKKALKASEHIRSNEKTIFSLNEIIFPRNEHVNKYIDSIVSEIMELEIIHNNFSEEFIEKNVISILEELNSKKELIQKKEGSNEIFKKLLKDFENKVKTIIKDEFNEYNCVFHIANLKLAEPINMGITTLCPVKTLDNKLKKYNEIIFSDFFKEGHVYAKTKAYGSKDHVHSEAQNNIKIALNMLKLLLDEQHCNFNLDGDVFLPTGREYLMFTSDDKKISSGFKLEGCGFHFELTKEHIEYNRNNLNILSTLFNKKNKSDFENRLIIAIYWFGEAISIKMNEYKKIENKYNLLINNLEFFNAYQKLLYLVIALETVFVFDNESKSNAVSSKVSNLIAKPEYKNDIEKFIKNIY